MTSKHVGYFLLLLSTTLLSGMLGGILALGLSSPQAQSSSRQLGERLTAREIRLVDEQGKVWARLGRSQRAEPYRGLILNDSSGQERLRLAVSEDGNGGLVMSDSQGRFRAALTVSSTGIPGIALTDLKGGMRFLLLVAQQGNPQMDLYDEKNRIALGLEVSEEGHPAVRMIRSDSPFGAARLDASTLIFQTEGFQDAVEVTAASERGGRLQLFDEEGAVRTSLPEDR